MTKKLKKSGVRASDQETVKAAREILAGKKQKNRMARLLPFLGPALIVSLDYVDPGNFATNIQAGSKFGYLLIWVIVASNLIAMPLRRCRQNWGSLRAKIWQGGIATSAKCRCCWCM